MAKSANKIRPVIIKLKSRYEGQLDHTVSKHSQSFASSHTVNVTNGMLIKCLMM